jgi:hypothetical protein
MPNGETTRFTHDWGDSIQTGGCGSGFYLGEGYISYSGGLDSGVKTSDLKPTDEKMKGWIWIFDKDIWGAGRGVDFEIDFRVFELIEGADLSGLPQMRKCEGCIRY